MTSLQVAAADPFAPAGRSRAGREQRRQAIGLAYLNALLWALGNGLASTPLITFLAQDLGARGLAVSFIIAMPQLIGVARIGAGEILHWTGDRQQFCLATYAASAVSLLGLLWLGVPGSYFSPTVALTGIVAVWSVYHLLEYCGTVSLWSWLGELAPARVRGRFFGWRERWLTAARIGGMAVGAGATFLWQWLFPSAPAWTGYHVSIGLGIVLLLIAVAPLARMPAPPREMPASASWSVSLAPLVDRRFLGLLAFGCWFSLANGIGQSAFRIYSKQTLGFEIGAVLLLEAAMRAGQAAAAPTTGRLIDAHGSRTVMGVSLLLVALGPLFYLATPETRWLMAGAYLFWIAYVGLNIGLPYSQLHLAPPGLSSAYLAAFFGISGVAYGLSTIAGGALHDWLAALHATTGEWRLLGHSIDHYQVQFVLATLLRLAGLAWLWLLVPEERYEQTA